MRILYLSNSKLTHSVNAIYIKGLEENGVAVHAVPIKNVAYGVVKREYAAYGRDADILMVGYDSPWIAVFLRLLSRKPIIYNALCSQYERIIVSRGLASRFSFKALYYWLSDLFAVHASSFVMLESKQQIVYFKKLFWIHEKKCIRAWTGVDERKFFYDPSITKFSEFTIIFRGSLVPEAGAEYMIHAAKRLEQSGVRFIMHAGGQELEKIETLIRELKPKNLKLITQYLSDAELRVLMQKSHISLGQLSDHERLDRTIPHKAYESLALGLPYLTAANKGVLELLRLDETCIVCVPADIDSLTEKILWTKENPDKRERIAENGHRLYKEKLTSQKLAENLLLYF